MPDSVDKPAPLRTTTPPRSTSDFSARSPARPGWPSAGSTALIVTGPWCLSVGPVTGTRAVVKAEPVSLAEWPCAPHARRKAPMTTTYELTDLEKLEAEAVHIFREVAA